MLMVVSTASYADRAPDPSAATLQTVRRERGCLLRDQVLEVRLVQDAIMIADNSCHPDAKDQSASILIVCVFSALFAALLRIAREIFFIEVVPLS